MGPFPIALLWAACAQPYGTGTGPGSTTPAAPYACDGRTSRTDVASLDHLHRFHDRHAGASDAVFGATDSGDGRPSYDRLADAVPVDATAVLDLACGDGALLERLVRPGRALTGLDANGSELAAAGARLEDRAGTARGVRCGGPSRWRSAGAAG